MKESVSTQHEVDRVQLAAAQSESKTRREGAQVMGDLARRNVAMQVECDVKIAATNEHIADAQAHVEASQKKDEAPPCHGGAFLICIEFSDACR